MQHPFFSIVFKITTTENQSFYPMFQSNVVEKCKANDRSAQVQLYRKYCEGMYIVAMRFVKDADDAEDVLQEAFIKAFQKIDQFKGDVTFGAWLKRIVINKCIDFLKSKKEYLVSLDEGYMQNKDDDENWNIEATITIDEVRKAIDNLQATYRCVVLMYLIEGYDHQEIAQVLNISETACRTRLLRGKAILKEVLKANRYGTGS
ncbi:RNA polymerase sigma-70 factor, ECF subfamily [Maribacter sedimenticola]|uniref:RNA polymerase sigma factor n=2 Tax=Maribacter sedimenticola TaxID=228956 RepID=A0ABY1SKK8_9FLAO|nr:RNA polymerase sigma-70 factor, ECF subfamily [Maribacter sedimenticola]